MSDFAKPQQLEPGLSAMRISDESGSSAEVRSTEIYTKSPKRIDQQSKSVKGLRQLAKTSAAPAVSQSLQSSPLLMQQGYITSPVTPINIQSPEQQWENFSMQQQPQPQQQPQAFDQSAEGLDSLLELWNSSTHGGTFGDAACQMPGSTVNVAINEPQLATLAPPHPPLPAQPAQTTFPTPDKGPGLSATTRLALLRKINPQALLVDDNFNTQLHNAVMQGRSREDIDYLLSNLRRQKKLLPVINLVNINGHTPLSLSLKMRRADLISLLLDFDAAPTQLCCGAAERTNHFHYAFFKCLDSVESINMVYGFIKHVVNQMPQSDLMGLLAKDRCRKMPLDHLNHRISQLRASQQDPASAELLNHLQSLKAYVCSVMLQVELQPDL